MTETTCNVCVENVTTTQKFECPFCEFIVCKKCAKRFLLDSPDDPACMNCKHLFDRDVLMRISKVFVDRDFKRHREAVLFEREMSMMPSTQPYVNQELQRRANVTLLKKLNDERKELRSKLNNLDRACFEVQRQILPPLETERRQFVHRCAHEGCRGYLSTAWRCTICERYTCSECNAPRGREREDQHVCREADKQTMAMLKNECKRCPGCAQYIYKISGCDQMWCTECHTAFSWRTGLKINERIHNPHFYEFQRTNNQTDLERDHGDVPCGGMPTQRELVVHLRAVRGSISQEDVQFLLNAHRLTIHIDEAERPRYEAMRIDEQANLDLRILYILNELSDVLLKQKLQQREKKNEKKRHIEMVLQMFVHTMSDLFRQGIVGDFAGVIVSMRALIEYVNTTLKSVSRKYNCIVPSIQSIDRSKPFAAASTHFRVVNVRTRDL